MSPIETPFSYLKHPMNLLLVDDEPEINEFFSQLFALVPMVRLHTATSAQQARTLIETKPRFVGAILDRGISDIENDEYYLIRKFGQKIPFVVFTGQASCECGARAILAGAKSVLDKPATTDVLVRLVFKYATIAIITPLHHSLPNTIIPNALDVLTQGNSIDKAAQWAAMLNVTEAGLRKAWLDYTEMQVKYILFIYRLYRWACTFYEQVLENGDANEYQCLPKSDEAEYHRHQKYYEENVKFFDPILGSLIAGKSPVAELRNGVRMNGGIR